MVYIHCVLVRRFIEYTWESERASGIGNGEKRAEDNTWDIRISIRVWCICAMRKQEKKRKVHENTRNDE